MFSGRSMTSIVEIDEINKTLFRGVDFIFRSLASTPHAGTRPEQSLDGMGR
jgi:hypothetical protein